MATRKHSSKGRPTSGDKKLMAVIKDLESQKRADLTDAHVDAIEAFISDSGRERRAALAFLARPYPEMAKGIEMDRDLALAFAEVSAAISWKADRYREVADLMEKAALRMRLALTVRGDCDVIVAEGERMSIAEGEMRAWVSHG